jgi:hypothetical protein
MDPYHNVYKSAEGRVFPADSLEMISSIIKHDEKAISRDREIQ